MAEHEAHDIVKLRFGVHDQVLKANEQHGDVTEFGIVHHLSHPVVDVIVTEFDPPIEKSRVFFLIVAGRLRCVVVHRNEMEERKVGVERIANNDEYLVGMEHRSVRHHPRAMRFDDPDGVVHNILATASLQLQDHIDVKGVVCTCDNSRHQLTVLAQECIATARERAESDFLAGVRLTVQESEVVLVEHPLCTLPKNCVLRLKKTHECLQVDDWRVRLCDDVHMTVKHVVWVETMEALRELLERLALFATIGAIQRPNEESLVSVE